MLEWVRYLPLSIATSSCEHINFIVWHQSCWCVGSLPVVLSTSGCVIGFAHGFPIFLPPFRIDTVDPGIVRFGMHFPMPLNFMVQSVAVGWDNGYSIESDTLIFYAQSQNLVVMFEMESMCVV